MRFSVEILVSTVLCIGFFVNLSAAAEQYPPDSVESIALLRAKELPDPNVDLPPLDPRATWNDKIQYSRFHCPAYVKAYVKAYEDIYLKQFHISHDYSPFLGYCEKRSTMLSTDNGNAILASRAAFKARLDRAVITYELSGGLAFAQAQGAQSEVIKKLTSDVSNLTKTSETLVHRIDDLIKK